jgi:protein-tyrosine phosphatase
VSPTNAASAEADLASLRLVIPNFRDVGGLSTGSGRPMRRGVVYRASQLFGLSPQAGQELLALGVTHVFDLRTTAEVDHRPDALPDGITLTVDDVLADRPHSGATGVASLINEHADRASVDEINASVGNGRARNLMIETYQHLVTLPSAHRGYHALLTGIASCPGAAVIHCTAGKDRSGWAVALLQMVAGVDMPDVLADYLLSNEPMRLAYGSMLEAFAAEGGDAESLARMMLVDPDYLDAALSLMTRQFGDLEGYLVTGLGLETSDIDRLRARLLA